MPDDGQSRRAGGERSGGGDDGRPRWSGDDELLVSAPPDPELTDAGEGQQMRVRIDRSKVHQFDAGDGGALLHGLPPDGRVEEAVPGRSERAVPGRSERAVPGRSERTGPDERAESDARAESDEPTGPDDRAGEGAGEEATGPGTAASTEQR